MIIITLYYEIFVAHQMSCGLIKFIFVVVAVVVVAVFVVVCIITIQSNLNVQMFQCLFSSIFFIKKLMARVIWRKMIAMINQYVYCYSIVLLELK